MRGGLLIHMPPERDRDRDDCIALSAQLMKALDPEIVRPSKADSEQELLDSVRRHRPDIVVTASAQGAPDGTVEVTRAASALIEQGSTAVSIAPRGYADRFRERWLRVGAGFAADDGSSAAVDFGSDIALGCGATLVVITVGDSTTWGFSEAGWHGMTEYLREKHEQALRTLKGGRRKVPDVVSCGIRLQRGDAAAELREAAKELDLLVVGGPGPTHLPGIAPIGDLPRALAGMSAPVLIVPERKQTPDDQELSDRSAELDPRAKLERTAVR